MRRVPPLFVVLLALGGCSSDLLPALSERQADEVVTALAVRGLDADKVAGDSAQRFRVVVPADQLAAARRALGQEGLPRPVTRGVGEAFTEAGMLPSGLAERARLRGALEAETERALENIEGVLSARVLLALPDPEPLRTDGARARSTASVVLRMRPPSAGAPRLGEEQVRTLVAAGVTGLQAPDVNVLITTHGDSEAADWRPARMRVGPLWLPASGPTLGLLVCGALAALGALVGVALRRARRPGM